MSTYTYTHAYTRAEAVVDQIRVLYRLAGIADTATDKVCHGVDQKWLTSVGLYLVRNGRRVYEIEARISWTAYSDGPYVDFSSDLPGWEGTGSPEAIILGQRFAAVATREGLAPHYWVRFTSAIWADSALHASLCPKVGVTHGSSVPEWAKTPTTRSLPLQDLREIGASERSAL
jgi:hypothetical protein